MTNPHLLNRILKSFVLLVTGMLLLSNAALAQRVTNVAEGVVGDMDKKSRSPRVTVTTISSETGVKLLVDAEERSDEFKKYPIQFDFYVNRQFFTSQIRSVELPGAIGVDIGPDVATTPFNFTVVAKVLHPNRVYTTVFTGAAFNRNLTRTLDCTLTFADLSTDDESDGVSFVANDLTTTQSANNALGVSFEDVASTDEQEEASLSASITLSDTDATAQLTVTRNGTTSQVSATGTAEVEDSTIKTFKVMSEDGGIILSCA
jgi:hypothetical protein